MGRAEPLRSARAADRVRASVPARVLLDAIAAAIHETGNPTLLPHESEATRDALPGLEDRAAAAGQQPRADRRLDPARASARLQGRRVLPQRAFRRGAVHRVLGGRRTPYALSLRYTVREKRGWSSPGGFRWASNVIAITRRKSRPVRVTS